MIDQVISIVAYHEDLAPRYRWLYPVFHVSWLKPSIGLVPDVETPGIPGNENAESEYMVQQILDVRNVK